MTCASFYIYIRRLDLPRFPTCGSDLYALSPSYGAYTGKGNSDFEKSSIDRIFCSIGLKFCILDVEGYKTHNAAEIIMKFYPENLVLLILNFAFAFGQWDEKFQINEFSKKNLG